MQTDAQVAPVAALLADSSRVSMLWALSDGRPLTAGALARVAGIGAATASVHLQRLVQAGILKARPQGRCKVFVLEKPAIVRAMEALATLAEPTATRSYYQAKQGRAVRAARTCYDHLAGALGVAVTERLVDLGALLPAADGFELSAEGNRLLSKIGIDSTATRRLRRQFARSCLDWSERRPHLAGALGAALLRALLDQGWLTRSDSSRAVIVTRAGRNGLGDWLGLDLPTLSANG